MFFAALGPAGLAIDITMQQQRDRERREQEERDRRRREEDEKRRRESSEHKNWGY
ncbi:hypothetical protein [Xanthomonas phage SB1]|uniref:Uncharacterized protein n=1 Tax=Xanthomonas phage SB1 TaxID=3117471 RepID=A0ABZ2GUE9_9CAUD